MSIFLAKLLRCYGLRAVALLALTLGLPLAPANAAPIYNQGIVVSGTFQGGGSLTGYFSLNTYGYTNAYFTFTLGAGTAIDNSTSIPSVTLSSALGDHLGANGGGEPNTIAILVETLTSNDMLYLTFQHALNIPGPDPFVIDEQGTFTSSPASAQCDGYACTTSSERLLASGSAEVPEPAPLALLASGLLALWAVRRQAVGRSR